MIFQILCKNLFHFKFLIFLFSFACNDQHEIIGNNATVCITDQDSFNNGVWSNKPPECRRKRKVLNVK